MAEKYLQYKYLHNFFIKTYMKKIFFFYKRIFRLIPVGGRRTVGRVGPGLLSKHSDNQPKNEEDLTLISNQCAPLSTIPPPQIWPAT